MNDPLLDVHDLHAYYGDGVALHGIDLSVARGSIVALLGPNGAGKSTTLRALTGAVRSGGSIRFDGREIAGRAPEDVARLGIAHVPEGRGTLGALTVAENLALGAYALPKTRARARHERVLAYFPWLETRREQAAGTLSGGEHQMLAIARALMSEPRLMLFDEPSLGLAPKLVAQVFEILRSINRDDGVGILIAEQNANAALALAERAYVLESGRVKLSGASADLVRDDAVRRSYLGV